MLIREPTAEGSGRPSRDDQGYCAPSDRILLPYQAEWYYDRSPLKVSAKSRRVGITWTTALEAVEVAATPAGAEGGMDVYFMTTSREDARSFVDECAGWIDRLAPLIRLVIGDLEIQESEDWFTDEDGNAILAFRIDFPSGNSIYALPSRPARMRGKQGYAILDEAAYQDVDSWLKAAGGMLMWGGRLAVISTYNGVDNGFYRLVQEIKGGRAGSLHETNIYEALADGLYRRICSRSGKEWTAEGEATWLQFLRDFYGAGFPEECECIVGGAGGRMFAIADIDRCMTLGPDECTVLEIKGGNVPTIRVDNEVLDQMDQSWEGEDSTDPERRGQALRAWLDRYLHPVIERINETRLPVYVGGDYGRRKNPTSFIFAVVGRDLVRRSALVLELENMRWEMQDQVLDYIWAHCKRIKAGCTDGTGAGDATAELAEQHTSGKVKSIKATQAWNDSAYTRLEKRVSQQGILFPRHFAPLREDMASVKRVGRKIVAPERTTNDDRQQKRHADSTSALAMLEASTGLDGPGTLTPKPQANRRPRGRRRRGRGRR